MAQARSQTDPYKRQNRKLKYKSPNSSSPSSCNCLLTFSLWSLGKGIKKVFKQFVEASAFSRWVLSSLNIIHFFCSSFDKLAVVIFCHPGQNGKPRTRGKLYFPKKPVISVMLGEMCQPTPALDSPLFLLHPKSLKILLCGLSQKHSVQTPPTCTAAAAAGGQGAWGLQWHSSSSLVCKQWCDNVLLYLAERCDCRGRCRWGEQCFRSQNFLSESCRGSQKHEFHSFSVW